VGLSGFAISVLPHLGDQDLKDMSVLLGHRRKMLAAIGESNPNSDISRPLKYPYWNPPLSPFQMC
jgi:hypothetical protein